MSKQGNNVYKIKGERVEFNPVLDQLFKNAGISKKPENAQSWNQLVTMYNAVAEYIYTMGVEINNAIKIINLLGITSNKELETNIICLKNDLETYTSDLLAIRARHQGKEGLVADGDDLVLCLSCYEDYFALNERARSNMFPIILTVTEFLQEAVSKNDQLLKVATEAAIADPTVITDVVVKETKDE